MRWATIVAGVGGKTLRVAHPWIAFNLKESIHQQKTYQEIHDLACQGMEYCMALGEQFGIKFLLEMHGGSLTASSWGARSVIKKFDSRYVGVIYDAANGMAEGHTRPRNVVEILGEYLAFVHAKNLIWFEERQLTDPVVRKEWKFDVVPLDQGIIDWVEVFFALNCVNYSGWISMEEFFKNNTEDELRKGLAFLKECAEKAPKNPEEPWTTFND